MMKFLLTVLFIPAITFYYSEDFALYPQQQLAADTLDVPYAYSWPEGGPFIGLCGEPYSLVFTGTVDKISYPDVKKMHVNKLMYVPQEGIIKIEEIKLSMPPLALHKDAKRTAYSGEKFFRSDCFYGSGLKAGDNVIAFIYASKGRYSIPAKSILKVDSINAPAVKSIEELISNHQNPVSILRDTSIWKNFGLDSALKRIVDCRFQPAEE